MNTRRELGRLAVLMGRFLTPAHKRRLLRVSLVACAVSLLEMLTAAATIPYMQCLADTCPAAIASRLAPLVAPGLSLIAALSLGVFLLIALKLTAQAGFNWMAAGLGQQVQRDTVTRLLDGYLHLAWPHFHARHRAHYLRRCATTAVDAAWVTQQCVGMMSSALLLGCLMALMLLQYPLTSLAVGAGFLLLNALTQGLTGRRQRADAQQRESALRRWNIDMAEAFASFREIRVHGLERFFLDRIGGALDDLAVANRRLGFLPQLPRQILDFTIWGILLLAVSVWTGLGYPLAALAPPLVFYAVAARVMLPAMMNLLSARAQLSGSVVNIQLVLDELQTAARGFSARTGIVPTPADKAAFVLDQVSFAHAPGLPAVLDRADLTIAHPSWVAVLGPSGAGKSTLMELLCGLHQPDAGRVIHFWPAASGRAAPRVAWVPQHVALLDGSVLDNVVFGFDGGDPARVQEALRLACLDHVVDKLPQGVHTPLGVDAGRLSGGERQRLSLARALYHDPDLLLLDEATSGLDEATEARLLAGLRAARPAISVVFVTHRPGNRRYADQIVELRNGRITAGGAP
jgi:ABC-type multidrug transport system fused ATPase/permease subunit